MQGLPVPVLRRGLRMRGWIQGRDQGSGRLHRVLDSPHVFYIQYEEEADVLDLIKNVSINVFQVHEE